MLSKNEKRENFIIRSAKQEEWEALATLHFSAYYDRFFDPQAQGPDGTPYGAPLAQDFPMLATGQNADYFRHYWQNFALGFLNPDPMKRNYCFVAIQNDRPFAFVKGSGAPIDDRLRSLFNRSSPGTTPFDADKCCELSSIYCDPAMKWKGIGSRLMTQFAHCAMQLGYESMATRAYERNDSPAFFEKLGAINAGRCTIENEYLAPDGTIQSLDIPGICLFWNRKAMASLVMPPAPPL